MNPGRKTSDFSLRIPGDISTQTLRIMGRSLRGNLSVLNALSLAAFGVDAYYTFSLRTETYAGKMELNWSVILII